MKQYLGEKNEEVFTAAAYNTLSSALFAYTDSDMDGVADSMDKCPNTPLTDLVDVNGCTKAKVKFTKQKNSQENKSHADVIIGLNYAGSNFASLNQSDTYSASVQADYYYGDFSLQAYTSYYKTAAKDYDESGLNDSFLGASYNVHMGKSLSLRLGVGALIPTYDTSLNNNNTDYTSSATLSYYFSKLNIFGGYAYTIINDDNVDTTIYQNTNAYSAGLGYYFTNKLYMSGAYNLSNSIYESINNTKLSDIKTASLYGYYAINKSRFLIFTYAYGLSDTASDNAVSLKAGYYF